MGTHRLLSAVRYLLAGACFPSTLDPPTAQAIVSKESRNEFTKGADIF